MFRLRAGDERAEQHYFLAAQAAAIIPKLERTVPLEAIIFQLLPLGPNRLVKYEIDGNATTTNGITLALTGKGVANWKLSDY